MIQGLGVGISEGLGFMVEDGSGCVSQGFTGESSAGDDLAPLIRKGGRTLNPEPSKP